MFAWTEIFHQMDKHRNRLYLDKLAISSNDVDVSFASDEIVMICSDVDVSFGIVSIDVDFDFSFVSFVIVSIEVFDFFDPELNYYCIN